MGVGTGFGKSILFGEHFVVHGTKAILAASMCYLKLGKYDKALEIAERLRLRMGAEKGSIIHIINIYTKMDRKDKALRVAKSFLKENPDNEQIKNLVVKLERSIWGN